jgi:hypothetical protein
MRLPRQLGYTDCKAPCGRPCMGQGQAQGPAPTDMPLPHSEVRPKGANLSVKAGTVFAS